MKSLLAGIMAFALTPVRAVALSCLVWGVEDAYDAASKSEDVYVVVEGKISFDKAALPKVNWEDQAATPRSTVVDARVTGAALGKGGFVTPFEGDVTLTVGCTGPWCAQPAPGDALMFLQSEQGGYSLSAGPCGGFVFSQPTVDMLRAVKRCHSGGACVSAR